MVGTLWLPLAAVLALVWLATLAAAIILYRRTQALQRSLLTAMAHVQPWGAPRPRVWSSARPLRDTTRASHPPMPQAMHPAMHWADCETSMSRFPRRKS